MRMHRFRRGNHRTRRRLSWALALAAASAAGFVFYHRVSNLPGTYVASLGNAHLQSPDEPHTPYNSDPPTSGPHRPTKASWGVHTAPVPRERQVHNLEDGGVVIQYRCRQACPELVERLVAVVNRYETQVLLAPYPGMERRIALTAWTRIDAFDDFDEARIVRFIGTYRRVGHHPPRSP